MTYIYSKHWARIGQDFGLDSGFEILFLKKDFGINRHNHKADFHCCVFHTHVNFKSV